MRTYAPVSNFPHGGELTVSKVMMNAPPPTKLSEDLMSGGRLFALVAAIELDLFSQIAAGNRTAVQLATAIGADESALTRLCDTLVAADYLRKNGRSYALKPVATAYLVKGQRLFMGEWAVLTRNSLAIAWSGLGQTLMKGKPAKAQDVDAAARFYLRLVRAIFPINYVPAKAAVRAIPKKARGRIRNILDIAAGSAVWSLPFAQALPQVRVTALDFPLVLEVAREYTEAFGVGDRYEYVPGNLREVNLGARCYDLVILGHILHGLGREWARTLIAKSAAALRVGGLMLIAEFIANEQRTGPEAATLFALNMLMNENTPEGDVYTMGELKIWLEAVGMKSIKWINAPHPSPLILATLGAHHSI